VTRKQTKLWIGRVTVSSSLVLVAGGGIFAAETASASSTSKMGVITGALKECPPDAAWGRVSLIPRWWCWSTKDEPTTVSPSRSPRKLPGLVCSVSVSSQERTKSCLVTRAPPNGGSEGWWQGNCFVRRHRLSWIGFDVCDKPSWVVNRFRYSDDFDHCQAVLLLVDLISQSCRNRRPKMRPVAVRYVLQNQSRCGERSGE